MSPWIQHVKKFAKAKGMKYNEALKSSACEQPTVPVDGGNFSSSSGVLHPCTCAVAYPTSRAP